MQEKTHLSNQAVGAVMMALQQSLMNQSDIVPVLRGFELAIVNEELIVVNPPTVHVATITTDAETTPGD